MLPSVLSTQIRQGITDFLETTFPVTTTHFADVITEFVSLEEEIFRGPFLSIRLPFEQGTGPESFPDVPMGLPPYKHQQQAFARMGGLYPRSTLIATGTGSGKTEAFLYPILSYCLQMRKHIWMAEAMADIDPVGHATSGTWLHDEKELEHQKHRGAIVARTLPMEAAANPGEYDQLRILIRFADAPWYYEPKDYERFWNQMLSALNILQFIPHFAIVADTGVKEANSEWIAGAGTSLKDIT